MSGEPRTAAPIFDGAEGRHVDEIAGVARDEQLADAVIRQR